MLELVGAAAPPPSISRCFLDLTTHWKVRGGFSFHVN